MVKFEIYLSDKNFDRLFALKRQEGKDTMTGNEYAEELLSNVLYRKMPIVPDDYYDDED